MEHIKLYNASVRLGGSMEHEVPRYGITAAEIALLNSIHGHGSVVNIQEIPEKDLKQHFEEETIEDDKGKKRKVTRIPTVTEILDSLSHQYGSKKVAFLFGTGFNRRIPNSIEELGPTIEMPDSDSPKDFFLDPAMQ